MAKAKTAPKLTKEQVLAALKQLSDEDREWVLAQLKPKKNKRRKDWYWWRSIAGIAEGSGGAVSEEHDKWVYVKDWEERNHC
ncbi:MAG: hypothetical protein NZ805_15360 [Armatimonadetes bacterium]|nr:hypothetical protein [Armatimonadota bacterium]MDW8029841.1 hypothetical protein [Armatimonadota bacterium]